MTSKGFAHLGLIIVVLIIGIGIISYQFISNNKVPSLTNEPSITDECIHLPEIEKGLATIDISYPRGNCYIDKAIETKDESYCKKIGADRGSRISECKYEVAAAIGEPELCSKIGEDIQNNIYENNCYKTIAQNKVDANICLYINQTATKDMCLSNVGKKVLDRNVCEMISPGSAFRRECLKFIEDSRLQQSSSENSEL